MLLGVERPRMINRLRMYWGLGADLPAPGDFAFFFKNNLILGLFWWNLMFFKRGIEIGSANMIKLVA